MSRKFAPTPEAALVPTGGSERHRALTQAADVAVRAICQAANAFGEDRHSRERYGRAARDLARNPLAYGRAGMLALRDAARLGQTAEDRSRYAQAAKALEAALDGHGLMPAPGRLELEV